MESTGAFPEYAVEMVHIGEASGRIERALRSLGATTTARVVSLINCATLWSIRLRSCAL